MATSDKEGSLTKQKAKSSHDFASTTTDAEAAQASKELVVARHGQRVLTEIVENWLSQVSYSDGYAQVLPLPGDTEAHIGVDAGRGFGQPILSHGGARVQDALAMFDAGEPLEVVADEFGVPEAELDESVRVALRRVASASMAPAQQVSLDLSLKRKRVHEHLRRSGWSVVTMAEHHGMPADETVQDDEWLTLAGTRNWAVLLKDDRTGYRESERGALMSAGIQCICLANASLLADEMADICLVNEDGHLRHHRGKRSEDACPEQGGDAQDRTPGREARDR